MVKCETIVLFDGKFMCIGVGKYAYDIKSVEVDTIDELRAEGNTLTVKTYGGYVYDCPAERGKRGPRKIHCERIEV